MINRWLNTVNEAHWMRAIVQCMDYGTTKSAEFGYIWMDIVDYFLTGYDITIMEPQKTV